MLSMSKMDEADGAKTPPLQLIGHSQESHVSTRCYESAKLLQDNVWGQITIPKMSLQFIDTPAFQRLRDLHQLGAARWVYPGATHTRFEHCIGTSYLANQWVTLLKEKHPEHDITQRDVDCVTIAGLVHDLGHGPFSHLFDGTFIPRQQPGSTWTHEHASVAMLEYLVNNSDIDFAKSDRDFVNALVMGEPINCAAEDREKRFLFDIVANKRNSVDVDKFDYLMRDCHHVGFKTDLMSDRLMKLSRIIDGEICFSEKESFNLYEMFHTRFKLHKRVYTHRVCKAVDHMITEALIKADPVLKLSDAINDMGEYLHLTDHILTEIYKSKDPNLAESRQIISNIHSRKLYKLADEVIWTDDILHRLKLSDVTEELICNFSNGSLKAQDIIVDRVVTNYAMKEQNPVDSIRFYSRWDDNKAMPLRQEQVSQLLPTRYQDVVVRVYSREPTKQFEAQQAFRALCEKRLPVDLYDNAFKRGLTIPNAETPLKRKGPMLRTPSADERSLKRRLDVIEEESASAQKRLFINDNDC